MNRNGKHKGSTSTWERVKRTVLGRPSAEHEAREERLDELLDDAAEATGETREVLEEARKKNGDRRR